MPFWFERRHLCQIWGWLVCLFVVVYPASSCSQRTASTWPMMHLTKHRQAEAGEGAALKKQAEKLLPALQEQMIAIDQLFTEAFIKTAGRQEIESLLREVGRRNGHAMSVRMKRIIGPYQAEIEFRFPKQVKVPATMAIERTPPHRITGLLFKPAQADNQSLDSLLQALKNQAGSTAVLIRRLSPAPEANILAWEENAILSIGSSFKLIVLAALVDAVQAKELRWSDVIQTREEWRSLPIGWLQDWPAGSPVTMHTLAMLMMNHSDNTATDHLIHAIGRERIEAMQRKLGFKHPERNQPLLCTGDLFRLKLICTDEQREAYFRLDEAGRRRWLKETSPTLSLKHPQPLAQPLAIDRLGWFASTADLCRVLDWIRQQPNALAILQHSRPFDVDPKSWPLVGFKGGAETGVLNYSLLLQSYKKTWYALSVTRNHALEDLEPYSLLDWLESAVDVLENTLP